MRHEKRHHVSTTADLTPLVVNGDPEHLVKPIEPEKLARALARG